ncbi:hypothetical protein AVEN_18728-1 [Araneus ventricosus]|uniref:Uncharacterized protein n=1 Tax=Araneus ventricosus TaxID=182803 RepID=A0A4Y2GJF2_ARAVE|nr:hypothetical protein AVEN_18728-1 [Araneus ventricosus]
MQIKRKSFGNMRPSFPGERARRKRKACFEDGCRVIPEHRRGGREYPLSAHHSTVAPDKRPDESGRHLSPPRPALMNTDRVASGDDKPRRKSSDREISSTGSAEDIVIETGQQNACVLEE